MFERYTTALSAILLMVAVSCENQVAQPPVNDLTHDGDSVVERDEEEITDERDDTADEDFFDEDMIDEDMIDEDMVDEDMIDEDMVDEDMIDEDMIDEDVVDEDMIDEDMIDEDMADEDMIDEDMIDDPVPPDVDIVPDQCAVHADCPFGARCDTAASPHVCQPASTCANDLDCASYQSCQVVENWKECRFDLGQSCQSDADCQPGEVCETTFLIYKTCRSLNKCATDAECAANEVCDWTGSYFECVTVCQKDGDCPFGYRCATATPHNLCEYANECTSDADCPAFNTCQASGNWLVCRFSTGGGLCTKDSQCDPSEYCDLSLGFFGTCKSRDQCQIDKDCGDGMVCEYNGLYNECVPSNPKQCYFDFQCPADWVCAQNVCTPQYAGICPEIEGRWQVLLSTSLLFTNGSAYEFIPKGGCSGSIKPEGQSIATGSFSQTAPKQYDITMLLLFNCQASITLNFVMQVTCQNGSATLMRN